MYRLQAAIVLALITVSTHDTAIAQQRFDGRWTIEAVPDKGACKRARQYAVVIENGLVQKNAVRKLSVSVAGGLDANGRIRGSVQGKRTRVDVTGSLSERSGFGDWTSTGRLTCSGRWNAERRS